MERARMSRKVSVRKQGYQATVADPSREMESLRRISDRVPDPGITEAIKTVYEAIFTASKQLQEAEDHA